MKPLYSLALLASLGCQPAMAQSPNCPPHADVVEHLATKYSEHPIGRGIATSGTQMIEIFVSDSGTWTAVVTGGGGAELSGLGRHRLASPCPTGKG